MRQPRITGIASDNNSPRDYQLRGTQETLPHSPKSTKPRRREETNPPTPPPPRHRRPRSSKPRPLPWSVCPFMLSNIFWREGDWGLPITWDRALSTCEGNRGRKKNNETDTLEKRCMLSSSSSSLSLSSEGHHNQIWREFTAQTLKYTMVNKHNRPANRQIFLFSPKRLFGSHCCWNSWTNSGMRFTAYIIIVRDNSLNVKQLKGRK